ncbi:hypothetical protein niasHT_020505 [Heterodera trifolii]|uniref:Transcription factor CBF/NF-Y/archaeal histone domain-containing protein n=1 Tax=Heterodera trifolii TaxID=157864 RepID=A0ABD2J9J8_9BILA
MSDPHLQLPIGRVKRICKLDPQMKTVSADAVKLLALAAEKYVALLGRCAGKWALANARKTVQICDIEQCIQKDWLFAILEDALTDWPEDNAANREEGRTDGEEEEEENEKETRGGRTTEGMEEEKGSEEESVDDGGGEEEEENEKETRRGRVVEGMEEEGESADDEGGEEEQPTEEVKGTEEEGKNGREEKQLARATE